MKFISALVFCVYAWVCPAQTIKVLHSGNAGSDSSYYDIFRLSDSEFWVGGKYGVLKAIGPDQVLRDVPYPNQGVSILKINTDFKGNRYLAADKGIVYINTDNKWIVRHLNKYSSSCFYDLCVLNSGAVLMCGGKSKIAVGKRTIPYGFILRSDDGGNSWKRVHRDWKRMFWKITQDPTSGILYALSYCPWGSRIFTSTDQGISWQKSDIKGKELWHDLEILTSQCLVTTGGSSGNLNRKKGFVIRKSGIEAPDRTIREDVFDSGLIWDYSQNVCLEAACGSAGELMIRNSGRESWTRLKAPVPVNLYKMCFVSDSLAYIIGSNKNIFLLDCFQDADLPEKF